MREDNVCLFGNPFSPDILQGKMLESGKAVLRC